MIKVSGGNVNESGDLNTPAARPSIRYTGPMIRSTLLPTLFVAFASLAFASCAAAQEPAAPTPTAVNPDPEIPRPPGVPVAFVTVDRGVTADFARRPGDKAVRDEEEWKTLWEQLHADESPVPPLPAINFSKDMAIAVFAGEKPSGGHKIEIASIERSGAELFVTVREKAPPPDAVAAQVLTYPYHVVRLPRAAGPVRIKRAE